MNLGLFCNSVLINRDFVSVFAQVLVGGAALSTVCETPSYCVHGCPSPFQLCFAPCWKLVQTQTLHQAHTSAAVLHCEFLSQHVAEKNCLTFHPSYVFRHMFSPFSFFCRWWICWKCLAAPQRCSISTHSCQ